MNLNYSFYINSLKKFLFFFSFLLIVLTFLNKSIQKYSKIENSYEFELNESNQVVIEPKFIGINKQKRPFLIQAIKAEKKDAKDGLYKLQEPSGEMKNAKGKKFFLNSKKGQFDQNKQKIFLFENVELTDIEVLSFKTDSAYIDLSTNDIYGNNKTFGFNNDGKIESNGFKIKNEGDIIIFNGPTNLLIRNK